MEIQKINADLPEVDTYGNSDNKIKYKGHGKFEIDKPFIYGGDDSTPVSTEKDKNDYIDSVIEELLKEEGNGPRKYIDWFYGEGADVVDWGAIFVSWIFNHNGDKGLYVPQDKSNESAGYDIEKAIKDGNGKWYESECTDPSTTPKKGDVVSFNWVSKDENGNYDVKAPWGYDADGNPKKWKGSSPQDSDNVGYVYKVDDDYIYVIRGNAGSSNSSSSTVTIEKYKREDVQINGYYRPNYDKVKK